MHEAPYSAPPQYHSTHTSHFRNRIFLRFYRISAIPSGLYADESALGYNAYSILTTGRDEYGTFLPLYFRSFDDYKLPVYVYATALSIKVFGVNTFAVRFPSALFGSLAIVGLYFLILELSKKRSFAILSAFFLALNPWQFFFSRAGYEVNVATAFLVFGTLFFVMAVNRKNGFFLFLISIIFFLLSIYTYNVTRLISPLLFLGLVSFYYKKITASSKRLLGVLLVLFFIGMLPFLITFITLQSQPGFSSHEDILLIGKDVKADTIQTRSYFTPLPATLQKIFFNYWVLIIWKYLRNLVSFFSTSFFFILGADHPNENIGGGLGMFYYFEFPLIILGAYQGLKKKVQFLYPFYLWFLVIFIAGSIIKSVPSGTRTYVVVVPFVVFSAYGMYVLSQVVLRLRNRMVKRSIIAFSLILIAYSYLFYFSSYFIRFPIEYSKEWKSEDQRLVSYITSNEKKYDKIVFDDSAETVYTSILFYGKYPAALHQKQAVYRLNGLVNSLVRDGKYEFRKIDWVHELGKPGTLFVTGKRNLPVNKDPLVVISYPTRPLVLYYDRKIGGIPVTDVAYEIFDSGQVKR